MVLAPTGSPCLRFTQRGVASNLMQTEIKMEEKHVVPTNNDSGKGRFRKIPPAHYTHKIESFSSVLESKIEKYETAAFEVGSSKWKLVFYPNGENKLGDDSGHISLFLALAEPNDFSLGWEVNVVATFFMYDQIRDRYLVVENDADEKEWRFHNLKTDWGFNSLLSHKALKDPSSGYLVHDCCTLGAELLVIKCNLERESCSLVKGPRNGRFIWTINRSGRTHYVAITVKGNKWKLLRYLKGDSSSKSHVPTNNDSGKRRFRKIPPTHYTLKIESFSSLLEAKIEKYETAAFEVGSSKWKLVIYPNGENKLGDNRGHISLFLALAGPNDLPLGWEVNVVASFFVYDQIRDRYLVVENDADEKEWRFHNLKTDWGFNSLLSHKALKDPSSGYLVHDCCTLGVELLVIKSSVMLLPPSKTGVPHGRRRRTSSS